MKTEIVFTDDQEVDEYDDYQYEFSNDVANDFIDEKIMPELHNFDYDNENDEYIPGIATFCLFSRLCIELINDGYTVDELKKMVEDFSQFCVTDKVH